MTSLSKKQISQLADIANTFSQVEVFNIEVVSTGGTPGMYVKFSLFETEDTIVDITDYVSW